ncbi:TPA: hypothetical protein DEP96_03685 [Candidatus Uhrbacteria bacterium]|nr:hypothetical protein [Candidatus Uhrbacteria bacterium]
MWLTSRIKGELLDAPVRDVLLQVLGDELDVRGLAGLMTGLHAGRRPYDVRSDLLASYLQERLEFGCYPGLNTPTTRQAFILEYCRYHPQPPVHVVGYNLDPDVIGHARNSVDDHHPGVVKPLPVS